MALVAEVLLDDALPDIAVEMVRRCVRDGGHRAGQGGPASESECLVSRRWSHELPLNVSAGRRAGE